LHEAYHTVEVGRNSRVGRSLLRTAQGVGCLRGGLLLAVLGTTIVGPAAVRSIMSGDRACSSFASVLPQQGPTVVLEPKTKHTGTVIFLHGLGDTGNGWKDVGEMLQPSLPHLRWVFPTAPERPVTINGGMMMPAWYDIKELGSRAAQALDGVEEAKQMLENHLEEEIAKGIPSERIIIGGFSQGAATSLFSCFQLEKKLAGVVALSGYLPHPEKALANVSEENKDTPLLMCHGDSDGVVRLEWARDAHAKLSEKLSLPSPSMFKVYPGLAHGADMTELRDLAQFIAARLPQE